MTPLAKVAVEEAIRRYGHQSDADLKTAAYMTAPMRNIMRKEQAQKVSMLNAPIDFLAAR